ncbi:AAA family ATPase [Patescibacteria group bacterium]|nr:AAA family ATPase [Patescibacteria group bacterium]
MNFFELSELQREIASLKEYHEVSLMYYFLKTSGGFRHLYKSDSKTIEYSKSSTSTCVLSLIAAGLWTPKQSLFFEQTNTLIDTIVNENWTSAELENENPFTVAFLLECILALKEKVPQTLNNKTEIKIAEAIKILINSLQQEKDGYVKGAAKLAGYPPSAFLTQLVVRVLIRCEKLDDEIRISVHKWSWSQIEHELSLIYSGSKSADPYALAYSILLYVSCTKSFESTPDESHILSKAISCIFESQLEDGSWPRSRPLFHYPSFGNAYCFEYEMLTQFLQEKELLEYSLKYLPNLSLAVKRLRDISYEFEQGGYGWASDHHPQIAGPESWSTASVYHFLHVFNRVISEAIRRSVFDYVELEYTMPSFKIEGNRTFCPDLWDSQIGEDEDSSLKETIFNNFVIPIFRHSEYVENGCDLPISVPMSAVFYGPPGTAKTKLAQSISEYLKWPLLTIDPSKLVRHGLDQVQAEANSLFSMIANLERCVVLLDEFDEMMRERTSPQAETLSRFLTTAMLPKLSLINLRRRIVFIVATNYINHFDFAIRRPGRFDLIIQVMPPKVSSKINAFPEIETLLNNFQIKEIEFKKYLEPLTYSEFMKLVKLLKKSENRQHAEQLMTKTFEKCTLLQEISDEENSKRWIDECALQVKYIRIPNII